MDGTDGFEGIDGTGGIDGMDGYEAVGKTSGWRDRSADARLRVTGADRVEWLQGLLTNDIAALAPGGGCYAAYLTPQGRMIADVRVLARPDHLLLDLPASQRSAVRDRLSMFIITEDAAIEDLTDAQARLSLHGPSSTAILGACVEPTPGPLELATLAEHANLTARFDGHEILLAGTRDLGLPGFDLYVPVEAKAALVAALTAQGAAPIGDAAWHTLRVEAGQPLFGVDMTTDTIPLEAGIEERAISFTKGCYVGQEIIVRVMHRGGGRVARKLVGLRVEGSGPAVSRLDPQSPIASGDRSIGSVTSAAWSPRLGAWIALGYVHRDFAEPGPPVSIGPAPTAIAAIVVTLPHEPAARSRGAAPSRAAREDGPTRPTS